MFLKELSPLPVYTLTASCLHCQILCFSFLVGSCLPLPFYTLAVPIVTVRNSQFITQLIYDCQIPCFSFSVGSDISDELWLFGPMFTAADISLSILLSRLTTLGLEGRYFPPDKCPCVYSYHLQVQKRPAFRRIQKEISNLTLTLLWENLKTASPYILAVLGIGTVTGVGYYVYKKVNS